MNTEIKQEDLFPIMFYLCTMLSFQAGVAVIYIVWPYLPHQSIWIVFIPLAFAFIQEVMIVVQKNTYYELLEESSGCEDV